MNNAWERAEEAGARVILPGAFILAHNQQVLQAEQEAAKAAAAAVLRAAFPILAEEPDDALRRISEWAGAYPADVFPEVDLKKARAALADAGIEIGSLHATWARHIMQGIGAIADGGRARIEQMKEPL